MQKVTLPFSTTISLELELDVVTAIVVSGFRTGLLLQTWSTAVKSSRIVRYTVLIWNTLRFAASICAMVT
jgi:hypothetical protein